MLKKFFHVIKPFFDPVTLLLLALLLVLMLAACSPRRIHYPSSVLNECPYEHLVIPPGPITEETIYNLVTNHDLDHKCIEFYRNLLRPIIKNKGTKDETPHGPYINTKARKQYKVFLLGWTPMATAYFQEALDSWNRAVGKKDFIELTDKWESTNILIVPMPLFPQIYGISLASPTLPCPIGISSTSALNTEEAFMETTVHEIGHCLGLDHIENGGIMKAEGLVGSWEVDQETVEYLKRFNKYLR